MQKQGIYSGGFMLERSVTYDLEPANKPLHISLEQITVILV